MSRLILLLALVAVGCGGSSSAPTASEQRAVVLGSVQALTDAMVYDIFSPPQAARVYAYATVAGYEAGRHADSSLASYAGRLNALEDVPAPDGEIDPTLASVQAFFQVSDALVFTRDEVDAARDTLIAAFGGSRSVRNRSLEYGDAVAAHVLEWASTDGYARTRSLPRFTPSDLEGAWQPTPPGYIEAIEPYWGELRPFVLEDVSAYSAPPPPPFSTDFGSAFFQDVREVYSETLEMGAEERLIASFWDCNPFVLHEEGHLSYATKKISPGGHWMGIVGIVIEDAEDSPPRAWASLSQTAIALADAFIVSWADKYRTNVIRPETVIRQTLSPTWQPLLQTPPFPEYTSGHSVISTAAAEVLTSIYGDQAFVDDVEVPYGLPSRSFTSFRAAAQEAAISRLYGGIHYRPAIENGQVQGRAVGEAVVSRVVSGTQSLAQGQ